MEDDVKFKLQRAAASAVDPEDRAWAAAKYQEMYGTAPVKEGVPAMLQRPAIDPVDAEMQRRNQEGDTDHDGEISTGEMFKFAVGNPMKAIKYATGRDPGSVGHGFAQSASGGTVDEAVGLMNIPTTLALRALRGKQEVPSMPGQAVASGAMSKDPAAAGESEGLGIMDIYRSGRDRFRQMGTEAQGRDTTGYLMGAGAGLAVPNPLNKAKLLGTVAQGAGTALMSSDADLTEGEFGEAALDTLKGGAISGGIGVAGKAISSGVRAASPWVRRAAEADESGLMTGAKALPKGREGVVRASEGARDKILSTRDQAMKKAGADYAAVEDISGAGQANLGAVRSELDKVRQANQLSSGQPINKALDDEIASLESMLLDDAPTSDLLALRRSLQERANFQNKSPSDREMAARKLYAALRTGVRESSSQLAKADDAFSAASSKASKTDELLGSSKPIKSVKQKRAAASELEYLGDESVPAVKRAPALEELRGMDPAYAQALKELEAKKALEATRLFTLEPGVRSTLSPSLAQLPFIGTTANLLQQYGRGVGRLADQTAAPALQGLAPRVPLSLDIMEALMQRRNQENPNGRR